MAEFKGGNVGFVLEVKEERVVSYFVTGGSTEHAESKVPGPEATLVSEGPTVHTILNTRVATREERNALEGN